MKDFKPKEAGAAGEAFDPSQDNIDRRTHRLQFGNVKVALLAKKTRGETVNVSIALHLGNEKALFGQRDQNASIAARMLNRGTTKFTRAELSDSLRAPEDFRPRARAERVLPDHQAQPRGFIAPRGARDAQPDVPSNT